MRRRKRPKPSDHDDGSSSHSSSAVGTIASASACAGGAGGAASRRSGIGCCCAMPPALSFDARPPLLPTRTTAIVVSARRFVVDSAGGRPGLGCGVSFWRLGGCDFGSDGDARCCRHAAGETSSDSATWSESDRASETNRPRRPLVGRVDRFGRWGGGASTRAHTRVRASGDVGEHASATAIDCDCRRCVVVCRAIALALGCRRASCGRCSPSGRS